MIVKSDRSDRKRRLNMAICPECKMMYRINEKGKKEKPKKTLHLSYLLFCFRRSYLRRPSAFTMAR